MEFFVWNSNTCFTECNKKVHFKGHQVLGEWKICTSYAQWEKLTYFTLNHHTCLKFSANFDFCIFFNIQRFTRVFSKYRWTRQYITYLSLNIIYFKITIVCYNAVLPKLLHLRLLQYGPKFILHNKPNDYIQSITLFRFPLNLWKYFKTVSLPSRQWVWMNLKSGNQ